MNFLHAVPTQNTTVQRTKSARVRTTVICPTILKHYNKGKGGTDWVDQLVSYYWPKIRCAKWPFRVYNHFFYLALTNSHLLYKLASKLTRRDDLYTLLSFIQSIVLEICVPDEVVAVPVPSNAKKARNAVIAEENSLLFVGVHTPMYVCGSHTDPITGVQTSVDKRRMCIKCEKRCSTICKQCNVALRIEIENVPSCWLLHHSAQLKPNFYEKSIIFQCIYACLYAYSPCIYHTSHISVSVYTIVPYILLD